MKDENFFTKSGADTFSHLLYLKPLKFKPEYTETQKAQFAAYIDCDGCIGAHTCNEKNNRFIDKRYRISIVFINTRKNLIEYIYENVKLGYIGERKHKNKNWKCVYYWKIYSGTEVLYFLKQIRPYLVAKKHIADTAIQFLESRVESGIHGDHRYSATDISLIDKIHEFNKRGNIENEK